MNGARTVVESPSFINRGRPFSGTVPVSLMYLCGFGFRFARFGSGFRFRVLIYRRRFDPPLLFPLGLFRIVCDKGGEVHNQKHDDRRADDAGVRKHDFGEGKRRKDISHITIIGAFRDRIYVYIFRCSCPVVSFPTRSFFNYDGKL